MKLLTKAGGSLKRSNLLFSSDEKYLLACEDDTLVVLDGKTLSLHGKYAIRSQEFPAIASHGHPLLSLCLKPSAPSSVLVSDESHIYEVEVVSGRVIKKWTAGARLEAIMSGANGRIIAIAHKATKPAKKGQTSKQVTRSIWELQGDSKLLKLFDMEGSTAKPTLSQDGTRLAWNEESQLFIWHLEEDPQRKAVVSRPTRGKPTHLALHATDNRIYYALASGRIHGYDLAKEGKAGEVEMMHWHAHAISDMVTGVDGRTLLSGGEEGVLVVWSLDRSFKQFLPHLGSPLVKVASSSEYYALLTDANTIYLVSPGGMQVAASYSGLKGISDTPKQSIKVGVVRDPRYPSSVLVNSIKGQLQSLDPHSPNIPNNQSDEEATDLNISQQSIIGRGKDSRKMAFFDVFAVAFSADSYWMATYERVEVSDRRRQFDSLRFWRLRDGRYHLYVSFDNPHGAAIKEIKFCPTRTLDGVYSCVTVGEDAKMNFWRSDGSKLVGYTRQEAPVHQVAWNLDQSITYKSMRCNAAAYSADGSIVAVAFDSSVHLLNPLTAERMACLSSFGSHGGAIKKLSFVGDYLVGADDRMLIVWDLLSLQVAWTLDIPVIALKTHPRQNQFVVIAKGDRKSFILSFSPLSPIPQHCYSGGGKFVDLEYIVIPKDGGDDEHQIVCLDNHGYLSVFSEDANPMAVITATTDDVKKNKKSKAKNKEKTANPEVEIPSPSPAVDMLTDPPKSRRRTRKNKSEFAPEMATLLSDQKPILQSSTPRIKSLNVPHCTKDELLLSQVPGHFLPPVMAAFEHFIKFKLPNF